MIKLLEKLLEDSEEFFEPASGEEVQKRRDSIPFQEILGEVEDYYRSQPSDARDGLSDIAGQDPDSLLQDEITTELDNCLLDDLEELYEEIMGDTPEAEEGESEEEYHERIYRELVDEVEGTSNWELEKYFSDVTNMDADEFIVDELMTHFDENTTREKYFELLDNDLI
jgi:hypothetical protein